MVSTAWLARRLGTPGLRILDASWHLPDTKRDARAEWTQQHIPGALFFDIERVADTHAKPPHMAPSGETLEKHARLLGIRKDTQIVVYDSVGLFSAARVWWLFRLFGLETGIAVLDGGLKKWLAERRPVTVNALEDIAPSDIGQPFRARYHPRRTYKADEISQALESGTIQLIDARSPARFRGEVAEIRPGVRAGHIPGAHNIHYQQLLQENGQMKTSDALREILLTNGIDPTVPVVTYCGSGVTAAILNLALEHLGTHTHSLYDGSWAEWGATNRPIEVS